MNPTRRSNLWLVVAALILVSLACAVPLQTTPTPSVGRSAAPEPNGSGEPSSQPSGNRLLANPTNGLSSLKSYHASFQQDVTGQLDGNPYERHTHLELTRAAGGVDFIRGLSSTAGPEAYFRTIASGKAVYRWQSADETCQGAAGDPGPDEILEPAKLLPSISQATRVGSETINGIPAVHYRFDQNGLLLADPKGSLAGEVWLAEAGGTVVKYTLTAAPPAKMTGKDLETGQTWNYELSLVDETNGFALPENCTEVPLDLPVPSDAAAVAHSSGWLEFTTQETAVQAANFYMEKLPGLGWGTMQKTLKDNPKLPYTINFTRENRLLSLNIDQSDPGGLTVTIFIYNPTTQSAEAHTPAGETSTQAPEPTVDPAQSGLPPDIPLYPGATQLIKQGPAVVYNAPDASDRVVQFFDTQMAANGWTMQNENSGGGVTQKLWQKEGKTFSIVIGDNEGVTYVAVTTIDQ